MSELQSSAIAIDGHNATGKSSVCQLIAARHSRRVLRPYSGTNGEITMSLLSDGNMRELMNFRGTVDSWAMKTRQSVVDRSWASTLSLVPKFLWWDVDTEWVSRTVILTCDVETALCRLHDRGRNLWTEKEHREYVATFQEIAKLYGIRTIDTSRFGVGEVAEQIERIFVK